MPIGLNGEHQKTNAALAIALCNVYLATALNSKLRSKTPNYNPNKNNYISNFIENNSILPQEFVDGLASCKWAGRAQKFHLPKLPNLTFCIHTHFLVPYTPFLFILTWEDIDGAHTPESTDVCATWFSTTLRQNKNPQPTPTTKNIFMFYCGRGRDPVTLLQPIYKRISLETIAFDSAIFPTFAIFPTTPNTLTKAFQNDNDPLWQKGMYIYCN